MPLNCGIESRICVVISTPTVAAIAAIPLLVSVETNSPSAANPISEAATTTASSPALSSPSSKPICVPEIVVTSPTGNSNTPTASTDAATIQDEETPRPEQG